ncbi:CLUMA_CG006159, isoform A [Clunio marinus]|uniref:CLUMA_CG006159, isoform A n=1 Tax=Clunio marinus TaxID=568069 RepID=A0A1J1HZ50_9DIPT|nr:CLUMA_CG006159, isoform A [Clunio marinus]
MIKAKITSLCIGAACATSIFSFFPCLASHNILLTFPYSIFILFPRELELKTCLLVPVPEPNNICTLSNVPCGWDICLILDR